jgi:hypothetical protein
MNGKEPANEVAAWTAAKWTFPIFVPPSNPKQLSAADLVIRYHESVRLKINVKNKTRLGYSCYISIEISAHIAIVTDYNLLAHDIQKGPKQLQMNVLSGSKPTAIMSFAFSRPYFSYVL